jgi:predicted RNA polymerase sigma factor
MSAEALRLTMILTGHAWDQTVALYGTLMTIRPSPVVALNRATIGRRDLAHGHFQDALTLARNVMERRFFEERVRASVSV